MALCPTWLAWMARVSQANSLGMMELTVNWNLDLAECASAPGNWQATAECDGLAQYACAVLQARMLFLLAAPPWGQTRVFVIEGAGKRDHHSGPRKGPVSISVIGFARPKEYLEDQKQKTVDPDRRSSPVTMELGDKISGVSRRSAS